MEFNETPRNIYKNGYSETSTRMTGQCNQVAERFFCKILANLSRHPHGGECQRGKSYG